MVSGVFGRLRCGRLRAGMIPAFSDFNPVLTSLIKQEITFAGNMIR